MKQDKAFIVLLTIIFILFLNQSVIHITKSTYSFLSHFNQEKIPFKSNAFWHALIVNRTSSSNERTYYGLLRKTAWVDERLVFSGNQQLRICCFIRTSLFNSEFLGTSTYKMSVIIENEETNLTNYTTNIIGVRDVDTIRYTAIMISFQFPKVITEKHEIDPVASFSIAIADDNIHKSFPVGIYRVKPVSEKENYFVCVNAVYGNFSEESEDFFVEWVEFNNLLGVKEIHLYNATWRVSEKMNKILNYYQSKAMVYVHQFQSPFQKLNLQDDYIFEMESANRLTRMATNTCFYEHRSRFKYMITIDLDELIVPYKGDTYDEMFLEMRKNENGTKLQSYSYFYAKWDQHYKTFNKTATDDALFLDKYQHFVQLSSNGKSFVSTALCQYSSSHVCLTGNAKDLTLGHASTLHYRKSCNFRCDKINNYVKTDYKVLRFKSLLSVLVNEARDNITLLEM